MMDQTTAVVTLVCNVVPQYVCIHVHLLVCVQGSGNFPSVGPVPEALQLYVGGEYEEDHSVAQVEQHNSYLLMVTDT